MSATQIWNVIWACINLLVMTPLTAVVLKFFARSLPFSRALLISLVASSVSIGLGFLYFLAKDAWGFSAGSDGLATLAVFCVAGHLITKLAKNYGIEKAGWLGVGAKSMLALVAISWVFVAVLVLLARAAGTGLVAANLAPA